MKSLFKKGIMVLSFVFALILFGIANVNAEEIFVKNQSGETKSYDVDFEETYVGDLKDIISDDSNIDYRKIDLIFAGNILDNSDLLSECNIQRESTLHLVIRNILTISVDGDGQIAYANSDEDVVYNDQMYEIINTSGTYKIGAKANEESEFVKWKKDGVDYSTDEEITVTLGTEDIELEAVFKSTQTEEYNENDQDGNEIVFTTEVGGTYSFATNEYTSITEEDIKRTVDLFGSAFGTFDEIKNGITKIIGYAKEASNGKGDLLKVYELYLYNNGNEVHTVDGGFKIRIKVTADMKGYDSYKLIYIADDGTSEDAIELTQNGEYLEGTLPHLSTYALVGSKNISNPNTGDNIIFYIIMLGLSIISIVTSSLYIKKYN